MSEEIEVILHGSIYKGAENCFGFAKLTYYKIQRSKTVKLPASKMYPASKRQTIHISCC
jgi:hypothetical protein